MKGFSIKGFIKKYFFNPEWRCIACGDEIFEGAFCKKCYDKLPFIRTGCGHCGRAVLTPTDYCLTCKGKLTLIDEGLSPFSYEGEIKRLIKKLKYYNGRYLAEPLAGFLFQTFKSRDKAADVVAFVPMSEKELKKRKFNQAQLLAQEFSVLSGIPIANVLEKSKETVRQATISGEQRRKNLADAFRVTDKAAVKGKSIVVIDDVTTTGSTGEAVAEKLKKAGAARVILLTVASVPYKLNEK